MTSSGSIMKFLLLATPLLLSLLGCCTGQIQCNGPLVAVNTNGRLNFSSLPAGAPFVQPVYNPGAVGGWYDLAGGFVDVVRPGNLPYGTCVGNITHHNRTKRNHGTCSDQYCGAGNVCKVSCSFDEAKKRM